MSERKPGTKSPYNYRWQLYRKEFLRKHPLCADHLKLKRVVQATVVDHITPHRGDQALFWDPTNHQSLCKDCHDIHKQRFETSGRIAGCDVDGVPLDPKHPWRQ